jgi:catechol 2,3-dioxygenase-like lactoylglutathione lyase family enzyme
MIGYVTIGTNDLARARDFYDKVLEPLGGKRTYATERTQGYSNGASGTIAVNLPFDGEPATAGNGSMFALAAPSNELVDAVYAVALEQGAKCEGPPGQRMPIFYGAYFRDPDGNKLCVFKMG